MLRRIYLQPGDKVALTSPSGVATKEQLDAGLLATPDLLGVGTCTRTTRSFPTREIGRHG